MKKTGNIFFFIFSVLIILPFILLLFRSNYSFMTHDGFYHVERTYYYATSLLEGSIPPLWARYYNYGTGSPLFLFLFPLPYWVSATFYLMGLNLVAAVKLSFIFFLISGVVSLYLFLHYSLKFKKEAAIVGTFLFAYSPYTLVQIFVRGSLREFAGMALFPLVLFFLFLLAKKLSIRNCAFLGLVLGLFFLTDGLSVMLFSLMSISIFGYLFIQSKEKAKFILLIFLSFVLGLSIAGYILLPYLFESKFLKWNTAYQYQDHFVYFWQYFNPRWGFGFSMPGTWDGMPFQIGFVNLLVIFSLILLIWKKKIKANLLIILLFINLLLVFLLMTYSPLSLFLWDKIQPLRNIQLAWRFLAVVVFIAAVFGAMVVDALKIKKKGLLVVYFFTILVSIKYLRTNQIVIFEDNYLFNHSEDATAYHEFIPVYRDNTTLGGFPQKTEVVIGTADVSEIKETNDQIFFKVDAETDSQIRLNTLYFPGWIALVDNREAPIQVTKTKEKSLNEKRDISGFMQIEIPKGRHEILFKFTDTPLRKTGKYLSITGVLITVFLISITSGSLFSPRKKSKS